MGLRRILLSLRGMKKTLGFKWTPRPVDTSTDRGSAKAGLRHRNGRAL
jgi:hypothetical protein